MKKKSESEAVNQSSIARNSARNKDGKFKSPNPNKRTRPKDPDELIAAIAEERLDRRLREVRQIAQVKDILSKDPVEVAKAILRHDIACNLVIQRALMDHAQKNRDELVDAEGSLPPALSKDFLAFQNATTKAVQALMKLEEKQPGKGTVDVADIILDQASQD